MKPEDYEELDEIEVEKLKLIHNIWKEEFIEADIPCPELIIERAVEEFGHHIILACYLPGSLISESKETKIEKKENVPLSITDYIKDYMKTRFPRLFSNLRINYRKIPIHKTVIVRKIGVHPSFFDIKHPLGSCYVLKYSPTEIKKEENDERNKI